MHAAGRAVPRAGLLLAVALAACSPAGAPDSAPARAASTQPVAIRPASTPSAAGADATQAGAAGAPWLGRWQSDHERTMAHARQHARLEPRQVAFLDSLIGHMTVEFGPRYLVVTMPDIQVRTPGGEMPFQGGVERDRYRVLHASPHQFVVLAPNTATGEPQATTWYIEDPDTLWVYSGSSTPGMPDLHLREYFRRLPPAGN